MTDFLNQTSTKKLLRLILKICIYLTLVYGVAQFFFPDNLVFYRIGKWIGVVAMFAFIATQIPGIIRRYDLNGVFRSFGNLIMFSRAHFGTWMFLLVWVHSSAVFYINLFKTGIFVPSLTTSFGAVAFFLSFPLFLTSNNFSKKMLKRNWDKLHSLVYLILWLIFLHVAVQGELIYSLILLFVGIIQIFSFIYAKFYK